MTSANEEQIMWATMIPKIGGSALGGYEATQTFPKFHLSYSEFKSNDSQIARYWPHVPFYYLDNDEEFTPDQFGEIDFITAVCPCSGLSMLNTSKSGQVSFVLVFSL